MKLDILAFGAHPDDVEISCSGTILKHIDLGYKCGIIDLTQGELGTRGSGELRLQEAERAKAILGIEARENLGFADGFFLNDREHQLPIIKMIRKYQPEIVLANSVHDRHPDHGKAAKLVADACFLAGLIKIETGQEAWRPRVVYHYIQDVYIHPDLTVDITPYFDKKMESIKAYTSQFYTPDSDLPETPISGKDFLDFLIGRAKLVGRPIGAKYAEGFTTARNVGVKNLFDLI
ncbi:MAG: bacillithiol biosynthesis deacetylase BshB1 [Flavobacteriales bacterium]|jgi:bacillithiol biosynthesis deacetylase BshB1|nr:bacillithiol biosynthesis deacetylase BshB1 [Flavobacteriales bacterium]